MLRRYVSTVAQKGQTKTMALEWAFRVLRHFTACRLSFTLGMGGVRERYSVGCNSATSPLHVTKSYTRHLLIFTLLSQVTKSNANPDDLGGLANQLTNEFGQLAGEA